MLIVFPDYSAIGGFDQKGLPAAGSAEVSGSPGQAEAGGI